VDDYFFRYRFTSFPVIDDEGNIEGIITIHAVKDVPRDLWHHKKVKEAMIPLKKDLLASPSIDAFEALTQMANNGVGRLIVTLNNKVIGLISQRDIIRLFEVKSDLGE
jgi:CBS domain-containing protein